MKKVVGALAAAALLVSLAPVGASAATTQEVKAVKVEKAHKSDRVLVKFKAGKDAAVASEKHGAKVEKSLGKSEWKAVKVPAGQTAEEFVASIQGDADVEIAELDYVRTIDLTPNDPSYGSQWHLPNVSAPSAWNITTGTTARTVAIIDTGVDKYHTDIASKLVGGYDFVNNDTNADDDHGHGTHCAGITAALTNNSNGVAGIDWNAKIMPIKVLAANGSGYDSDIIDGIYYAADYGAHVLSMSLGGGAFSQATQDAINYAVNTKGRIVVAAAGNDGVSTKSYPAAYANVVAVASTTSGNVKSSFSNYGTWVDVAAPGSSILSLRDGGGTVTMSGTSMATPLVAGVMSLTWSKNTAYAANTVVNRVLTTSDAISGTGSYWTYGKVNAYRAVDGF